MTDDVRALNDVIGSRIRAVRSEWRLTQDDLARAAEDLGLPWNRSTVAKIEAGDRALAVGEFLALPQILDGAVYLAHRGLKGGPALSLGDLVDPGKSPARVALTPRLHPGRAHLRWLKDARPPELYKRQGRRLAAGEAERHVARVLSVDVPAVAEEAERRWITSLTDERDRRVGDRLRNAGLDPDDVEPRSLQATRGHVTRELIEELRPTLAPED